MSKNIRIPDDLYAKIAALAAVQRRSITQQAAVLLAKAVADTVPHK